MKEYIQTYEEVFTTEDCGRIIDAFNDLSTGPGRVDNHKVYGGAGAKRNDIALFFDEVHPQAHKEIHERIGPYIRGYMNDYPLLDEMQLHSVNTKVQRTEPGAGYHIWHCEQSKFNVGRNLVWMVYLNTLEEGGETEFLTQQYRIKPVAGTLAVWPAYWPWAHRGNPPLSDTKYIATGWYLDCVA